MNTDTGRIYEPETLEEVKRLRESALEGLGRVAKGGEFPLLTRPEGQEEPTGEVRDALEDLRAGRLVEVSEAVAQQVKLGQRELERRRRRRQAAKKARRRNR